MKRSQINALLRDAAAFFESHSFRLPPFAFWSPQEWATKGSEYDEIRHNALGWDITDFGSGDFERVGLLLFTVRNGNHARVRQYPKPYAEKIMIAREGQVTPYHFHWRKMEDIINRGGGNLLVKLYNDDGNGEFADTPVMVCSDGRRYQVPAGSIVRLTPGQSITLAPGQYHSFWGEPGCGTVLIGEVSQVNDDSADNRFHDAVGRFPTIEEDEPKLWLLGNEYPAGT